MPWQGVAPNQTFVRTDGTRTGTQVWQEADAAAVDIIDTDHDTHDQDIATALNLALKKDGGNAATGNIPMGGNRFTNAGDGQARTDFATMKQVQDGGGIYCSVSGTANAITLTTSFSLSSLTTGIKLRFKATATNTGAVTVTVDSAGAKALVMSSGAAVAAGTIISGGIYEIAYDGTSWQLLLMQSSTSTDVAMRLVNVGDVMVTSHATPKPGRIRLGETTQTVLKADYPELDAWLSSESYPWGSTTTTATLPSAAGYFLRFAGSSSSVDPSGPRTAGNTQSDTVGPHNHPASATTTVTPSAASNFLADGGTTAAGSGTAIDLPLPVTAVAATTVTVSNNTGTTETRAKNVAYHADMIVSLAAASAATTGVYGLNYAYSTSTSGDPTAGRFGFDTTSLGSIASLRISETDGLGVPVAELISLWDDVGGSSRTTLVWRKVGAPGTFIAAKVNAALTDNGGWDTIPITYVKHNGTWANGDQAALAWFQTGDQGATGATGSTGAAGSNGTDAGIRFNYDSSTTMADPGAGDVRFNNASLGSITAMAISYTNAETGAPSVANWIKSWDDSSTSAHRGTVIAKKITAPQNYVILDITSAITDNTTWGQFTVAVLDAAGSFTAADLLSVSEYRTGDQGAAGAGSGDVIGPASSVDSEIVLFSSTSGKVVKRATTTGIIKASSGVIAAAVSGTDYAPATSGTGILKGNGSGGFSAASPGTDYAPATSGSSVLKGNGSGGTSAATAGTDFVKPDTATAFTAHQGVTLATLTDGANISWTVSSGQKAKVTLGGNRTMNAVTGAVEGYAYLLWVIQDGTGSRTLSWTTSGAGSFDFGTDGAPVLTTTASKADLLAFEAISIGGTLKLRFAGIKKGFA